jgi:hypothetical protein
VSTKSNCFEQQQQQQQQLYAEMVNLPTPHVPVLKHSEAGAHLMHFMPDRDVSGDHTSSLLFSTHAKKSTSLAQILAVAKGDCSSMGSFHITG